MEEFIAFLKAHQSEEELHNYKPTQEFLLPRYTLESVGRQEKKSINLDSLKVKVETIDLQHSMLSNEKIFILRIGYKDLGESYPWQILIKASNNGHFAVKFCAGI